MFYRIKEENLYDYADYKYSQDCLYTDICTQKELDKDRCIVTVKDGVLVLSQENIFRKAKAGKLEQNKTAYDKALKSGVVYKGSLFDCDTLAAVRIMGQLSAIQASLMQEENTIEWFDYDYQPVVLTIQEFGELAAAVTMNTRRIETLNCQFNTAIQSAQSISELNSINIDYTEKKNGE